MANLWESIKSKKETRAKLGNEINAFVSGKAEAGFTAEDDAKINQMHTDIRAMERDIERLEKVYDLEKSAPVSETRNAISMIGRETASLVSSEDHSKRYAKAFNQFIRQGFGSMDSDTRSFLNTSVSDREIRSLTVGGIGVVGTREFGAELFTSQKNYCGPLDGGAKVYNRSDANPFIVGTRNDTAQTAAVTAEAAADAGVSDPSYGNVTLAPSKYDSGWVKLSIELLQDNEFNAESDVISSASERIGRALNTAATVIVKAATVGKTVASATAITYAELVDFVHSLNWAYRRNKKAVTIQISDASLAYVRKIVDGNSRPIVSYGNPGLDQPDTLLGFSYIVNDDMGAQTTGLVPMAIADCSKAFACARVTTPYVVRADQLFIGNGLVGFKIFDRIDFKATDALACKTLKMA